MLARTLYRVLLREARAMRREGAVVALTDVPDPSRWGLTGLLSREQLLPEAVLSRALPAFAPTPAFKERFLSGDGAPYDGAALADAVRGAFKEGALLPAGGAEAAAAEDCVFELLRLLPTQRRLTECTSATVTRGVEVQVTTHHLLPASLAAEAPVAAASQEHIFMYRVRLRHTGAGTGGVGGAAGAASGEEEQQTHQLQGRHLIFRDESGDMCTAVGPGQPGVVGEYPVLQPASSSTFEYFSGCTLPTPGGSVEGSFQMVTLVPPVPDTAEAAAAAEARGGEAERAAAVAAGEDWEEGEMWDLPFQQTVFKAAPN